MAEEQIKLSKLFWKPPFVIQESILAFVSIILNDTKLQIKYF